MNDGLGRIIDDREEVERVGVKIRVRGEACIEKTLLKTLRGGKVFIVAYRPAVGAELVRCDACEGEIRRD